MQKMLYLLQKRHFISVLKLKLSNIEKLLRFSSLLPASKNLQKQKKFKHFFK